MEYCDLQIDKDQIFIASFSLIDIYKNNQLLKRISIDDIDGIRFSSLIDNTLNGAFRQIDQFNFDDWISFNLNTLTHEFNCDHGRMWEEISDQGGKMTTRFLTMGLK